LTNKKKCIQLDIQTFYLLICIKMVERMNNNIDVRSTTRAELGALRRELPRDATDRRVELEMMAGRLKHALTSSEVKTSFNEAKKSDPTLYF
jgi:hypothetical protein